MIKNLQKNKGALLFLVVVSLILILPLIIHQYPYPNLSDDTPRYLAGIERMIDGDSFYEDFGYQQLFRYTAPAFTGLIIKALHTDPYWTFYILHYLALIAITISVWFFCTKAFNKLTGYIGTVVVMFCTPSLMQFFLDGAIFNLVNLLIFGLMGILALIYWLKTKRIYYAVVSMLLLFISVVYHSTTGLEIFFGVLVFLISYIVWNLRKHKEVFFRVMPYLVIFGIVGSILIGTLCPESKSLIGLTSSSIGDTGIGATSVTMFSFIMQKSSMLVILLASLSLIYTIKQRANISAQERLAMGILVGICVVITATVFFKFGNPDRSAQDLGIMLAIIMSGVIGFALYIQRERFKRNDKIIGLFVLIVITLPVLIHYYGYNSAVTKIDQQAIEFVNTLEGDTYSGSTQLEPSIYGLFINKEYVKDGDYIIYRSKPMSGKTNPDHPFTLVVGNTSIESDYAGLLIIWRCSDGNLEIIIYER
jgi:hypothetical protein